MELYGSSLFGAQRLYLEGQVTGYASGQGILTGAESDPGSGGLFGEDLFGARRVYLLGSLTCAASARGTLVALQLPLPAAGSFRFTVAPRIT